MLSIAVALAVLFLTGLAFDQLVQVILASQQPAQVRVLLLAIVNDIYVLGIIAVCYFVDGFVVHGEMETGWIGWGLLVAAYVTAYGPLTVLSVIRLIRGN